MDDLAKRVRAARGYAGLNQPDLAAALGMSTATLKRFEGGKRDLGDLEREAFLERVAAATSLPVEFFTVEDLGGAVEFAAGIMAADTGGEATLSPPADPVLESLQRIEAAIAEFRETWGEQALTAIGVILAQAEAQDDDAPADDATSGTGQRQHPPAVRRAG